MAMIAIISLVPMAAEAIEVLLNKFLNNDRSRENQLLSSENKRLREQLAQHSNEKKHRNDAPSTRNQHLINGNAVNERKTINDPHTAQLQQFLEPNQTHDEESDLGHDATAAHSHDQSSKQMNKQEKEGARAVPNVKNESSSKPIQSNEKDLQTISNELEVENFELEKQLEDYQKQHEDELVEMEKLLAQLKAKKLNSFEDIENQDKQAKERLIELAKKAKPIEMEGNNIAFFGLTATGKSTILNALVGEKVAETGIGETTVTIRSYKTKDCIFWDIPGKNDEVSYMGMQYISFYKGLTHRLILITHTLKENSGMMKFLDAIGLNYDIVVNKMDQCDEEERSAFCATIQEEKVTLHLKGVGRIFFVSAKFPQAFPGWLEMVHYLSTLPK